MLTISVSVASSERSFSKLKILTTYLKINNVSKTIKWISTIIYW